MIFDVADLIRKKVSKKKVHLVYDEEDFYDDGEKIEFLKPITLEGELHLTGDIITLDGKIITEISLPCSRCLVNFSHNIDIQIHEEFSTNLDNKDDEIIFIDSDTIDITNIVRSNIILSLPIKKLCDEDCKGLCQNCGVNLNETSCSCQKDDIDPRFAKLKDLFSAD
ncbi:putative ACR [Clostridiales bacterium oral taxon 876 str. F0540]|nr:putative ACR [Clostridiales bacterium oral taxon 876 str. F0540]